MGEDSFLCVCLGESFWQTIDFGRAQIPLVVCPRNTATSHFFISFTSAEYKTFHICGITPDIVGCTGDNLEKAAKLLEH